MPPKTTVKTQSSSVGNIIILPGSRAEIMLKLYRQRRLAYNRGGFKLMLVAQA